VTRRHHTELPCASSWIRLVRHAEQSSFANRWRVGLFAILHHSLLFVGISKHTVFS